MSDPTIERATVDVDGTPVTITKTGENTYLVAHGEWSFPIDGYDEAVAAAPQFAAEVEKVLAIRANAATEEAAVFAYADARRDSYEAAKERAEAGEVAEAIREK